MPSSNVPIDSIGSLVTNKEETLNQGNEDNEEIGNDSIQGNSDINDDQLNLNNRQLNSARSNYWTSNQLASNYPIRARGQHHYSHNQHTTQHHNHPYPASRSDLDESNFGGQQFHSIRVNNLPNDQSANNDYQDYSGLAHSSNQNYRTIYLPYQTNYASNKRMYRNRNRFEPGSPLLIATTSNVDHGQESTNSLAIDPIDDLSSISYSNEDSNFNMIPQQASGSNNNNNMRRVQSTNQIRHNNHNHNHNQFNQMNNLNNQRSSSSRKQHTPTRGNNELGLINSISSCGECHKSSKRLSSRQFCHLDFALKAKILSKTIRDDWTRIDAQVLDVFKSPATKQNELNKTDIDSLDSLNEQASNRIKLNTIHSIWVPTEDLTCKCLRLPLSATYLILGK